MATLSRLVRIFISSTFRDFLAERDDLVKKVFPELRRRCKDRFVFAPVKRSMADTRLPKIEPSP